MAADPEDGEERGEHEEAEGEAERDDGEEPLPDEVVDEAERLTRLAREAVDEAEAAAYRADRDDLLADHDYAARVREDDDGDVLVCYPAAWLADGVIQVEAVEDLSRGVEVPLSGPEDDADWEAVERHNGAVADAVAKRHGEPHGATASALADFASNHYAKRIEAVTAAELREFRTDYFPRNAFPDDDQRAALGESLRLVFEAAETEPPLDP